MPGAPYPVTITAFDIDNTTKLSSATVTIIEIATQERLTGTTNAAGQVILDLSNFTSGYTNGDVVHIIASKNWKSGGDRHVIDTGTGSYDSTIYADGIPVQLNTCKLVELQAVSAATAGQVRIYDNHHDNLVATLKPPANDTRDIFFGDMGKICVGGFTHVKTRSDLEVTVKIT